MKYCGGGKKGGKNQEKENNVGKNDEGNKYIGTNENGKIHSIKLQTSIKRLEVQEVYFLLNNIHSLFLFFYYFYFSKIEYQEKKFVSGQPKADITWAHA